MTAEGRRGPCRDSRLVIGFAIDLDLVLVFLIVIEIDLERRHAAVRSGCGGVTS